ncbi:EAL domain-containing protein, partial [Escherichia coli]
RLRLAAEPQTGRREVSALTDARKTLAYDFFRILRAPLLEITERQGGDFEEMKEHIDFYKKHGVRFAIDDFGTGYSNLNLITALDVDEIKIDKSLTDAIGTESLSYNLLPGLYEMFRNISDKIVFEGVETQEQVNYLKKFWPQSSAQGWYYSRALTLAEATELICRHNTK